MKRIVAGGALVLVVTAAWWFRRSSDDRAREKAAVVARESSPSAAVPETTNAHPEPALERPPSRVVRIGREERMKLAQRIEAARVRRLAAPSKPVASQTASQTASGAAADTGRMSTAEQVLRELQGIARETSAATEECAKRFAPDVKAFKSELTLVGDPDVGTLIDAATPLVDPDGKGLPQAFDDCVRAEFQNLALPPMPEGDTYTVTYSVEL